MFLILFTLLSSWKPIRDTTIIITGNDTIWITGNKMWSSGDTIFIDDILKASTIVGKSDSSTYSDSASWADTSGANFFAFLSDEGDIPYLGTFGIMSKIPTGSFGEFLSPKSGATGYAWYDFDSIAIYIRDSFYLEVGTTDDTSGWHWTGDTIKIDTSGGGGGTTDSIYVLYGDSYGTNGWYGLDDTLKIDTLWRSEARVDTFGSAYLVAHNFGVYGFGAPGVTKSWYQDRCFYRLSFDAAGEYGFVPLKFDADSIFIDSIAFWFYWANNPPDADTFFFGYSDSTVYGNYGAEYWFTIADTVGSTEVNEDQLEQWTLNVGRGYKLNPFGANRVIGAGCEYEKETGTAYNYIHGIIAYYTACNKR